MKIAVFGTGYVGLVAAICFADSGTQVIGVDIDESKIKALQDGIVPIYEPGLEDLLKSTLKSKRVHFTTDAQKAIKEAQVIFVAVGTPEGEDGSADLTHVLNVVKLIGQSMTEEKFIVLKSTVPVGTAEKVEAHLQKTTKLPFEVINNPEFLKEGSAVQDFLKPDRVIIGCKSEKAKQVMSELYGPFVKNGHPIIFMQNKAAELSKYAANAFLATKISFINELALLADKVGADIDEVKKGFTSDSRINPAFFYPGVGYGGSCFPKDVKALVKTGEEHGVSMEVIKATDRVNDEQKTVLLKKIRKEYKNLSGLTLAIWGLAFKPRTDDIREAPALAIIDALLNEGAKLNVFDPIAMPNTQKTLGNKVSWCEDSFSALKNADGLIIVTEWNEFRNPDFTEMSKLMKKKIIFDGRNIYDAHHMKKLGFTYYCIGRENV